MNPLLQIIHRILMLILALRGVAVVEERNIRGYLKMLNQEIELLKDRKYEEFTENGRFVTSIESILIFDRIWSELSQNGTKKIIFPEQIIWINGAPGSGKGTNTRTIMRMMKISARPIVVSELLDNNEKFKQKINQGLLIDDEDVTLLLFQKIFERTHTKSIIVDGYPRSKVQAECIKLLQIKSRKSVLIKMSTIVLLIDERTSIRRQLARGQDAIERNKKVSQEGKGEFVEVRKTDTDPETARKRCNEFRDKTYEALKLLKKFTNYYDIDAKGSINEVKARITEKLKK